MDRNDDSDRSSSDPLRINKLSHKISKPTRRPPPHAPPPDPQQPLQQQAPQPPVYNINKNDFRELVQKLTGSPSHTNQPLAPPPLPPQPRQTSRLHRIRPPPLVQISNQPPVLQPPPAYRPHQVQPMSPLPPLPSVNTSAESPISAYMRFLQSSTSGGAPLSPLSNFGCFSPSGLGGFAIPPPPLSPVPSPGKMGN